MAKLFFSESENAFPVTALYFSESEIAFPVSKSLGIPAFEECEVLYYFAER